MIGCIWDRDVAILELKLVRPKIKPAYLQALTSVVIRM